LIISELQCFVKLFLKKIKIRGHFSYPHGIFLHTTLLTTSKTSFLTQVKFLKLKLLYDQNLLLLFYRCYVAKLCVLIN